MTIKFLIQFLFEIRSSGMVLAYIKGWAFGWRATAWMCVAYSIAPFILITFIPESAVWLISKGKNEKAKKSLQWFTASHPNPIEEGVSRIIPSSRICGTYSNVTIIKLSFHES